ERPSAAPKVPARRPQPAGENPSKPFYFRICAPTCSVSLTGPKPESRCSGPTGRSAQRSRPEGPVCGSNSVVECDLAKVEVVGSNPISRSEKAKKLRGSGGNSGPFFHACVVWEDGSPTPFLTPVVGSGSSGRRANWMTFASPWRCSFGETVE